MNDSSLIELMYLSRSTAAHDGAEAPAERFIESAREVNLSLGVTGALLVGKQCFVQILEGPASAVDEIFEKRILPATSHTDVLVISRKPRSARTFRDWSMALVSEQTGNLDRFVEHRAWEIETASSLSEPPSHWPLDILLEEVSRIVDHVTTTSADLLTDRAVFG